MLTRPSLLRGAGVGMLLLLILLVGGCEPTPSPVLPPTGTTTPSPTTTTAPPAGLTVLRPSGGDDTARFVAAVQAGNVSVDGPLLIDNVAKITANNRVISFSPNGSLNRTFRSTLRTFEVLLLKNSTGITINNLQIRGPNFEVCDYLYIPPPPSGPLDVTNQTPYMVAVGYNPKYEAQHGLSIDGGSNIVVDQGRIFGMSGDGIYITHQVDGVRINNVSTECTGRSSVSNVGSSNVRITGGTFKKSGYWIFNVEPDNSASVANYYVDRPTIGFSNFRWLYSSGPYYSCLVTNVIFYKPTLIEANVNAPAIAPCARGQVTVIP